MCGRYTVAHPARCLAEFSKIERHPVLEPRYNVAPSDLVPVVRFVPPDAGLRVDLLRWGLVPGFRTKQHGKVAEPTGFIMARAESVAQKPAFAAAFRERRCLFLADGFYEWARAGSRKLPYYIHRPSAEPFTIAGIWEPAREGQIDTCALITRPALAPVDALHDRMPAVIHEEDRARWLDPEEDHLERLGELLSAARPELSMFPVSPRVNATRFDDPSCILPRPDGPQPGDQMDLFPAPRLPR